MARVRTALQKEGVDALLVGPSPDLAWLTGYDTHLAERLTLLVLPAEGPPSLVVPALEAARARAHGADALAELHAWDEVDDPVALVAGLLPGRPRALAVQDRLFTMFTLRLQAAVEAGRWVEGGEVLGPLREVKDDDEIAALHRAGAAIDRVHAQLPGLLRAGRTEAQVGAAVRAAILEEHDRVNFAIVASGPNGASPHHETSDRVLAVGDPVVVDIGGTLAGYCSDETRNYVVGTADPGYRELHAALEASNAAGHAAVRPGATAAEVDGAARGVLVEAGWGEQFVHRTGHGIGLEEHERPWIVAGNDQPLMPGMAFSIEPGIYVDGRWGARIEDIVTVGDDGTADTANHRPRGLVEVAQ
jgi:Xaa-Pro aminopeptidase